MNEPGHGGCCRSADSIRLWWALAGVGLIWIDHAAGPLSQFPVLYVIPVSLAAWYSGRRTALALATVVPVAHLLFLAEFWTPAANWTTFAATVVRGAVIFVMALWIARLSEHERALTRYVQRLEGLLPICAFCKSIRNTDDQWEPLETFISTRSDAEFSHGFCPTCVKTHYEHLSAGVVDVSDHHIARAVASLTSTRAAAGSSARVSCPDRAGRCLPAG